MISSSTENKKQDEKHETCSHTDGKSITAEWEPRLHSHIMLAAASRVPVQQWLKKSIHKDFKSVNYAAPNCSHIMFLVVNGQEIFIAWKCLGKG